MILLLFIQVLLWGQEGSDSFRISPSSLSGSSSSSNSWHVLRLPHLQQLEGIREPSTTTTVFSLLSSSSAAAALARHSRIRRYCQANPNAQTDVLATFCHWQQQRPPPRWLKVASTRLYSTNSEEDRMTSSSWEELAAQWSSINSDKPSSSSPPPPSSSSSSSAVGGTGGVGNNNRNNNNPGSQPRSMSSLAEEWAAMNREQGGHNTQQHQQQQNNRNLNPQSSFSPLQNHPPPPSFLSSSSSPSPPPSSSLSSFVPNMEELEAQAQAFAATTQRTAVPASDGSTNNKNDNDNQDFLMSVDSRDNMKGPHRFSPQTADLLAKEWTTMNRGGVGPPRQQPKDSTVQTQQQKQERSPPPPPDQHACNDDDQEASAFADTTDGASLPPFISNIPTREPWQQQQQQTSRPTAAPIPAPTGPDTGTNNKRNDIGSLAEEWMVMNRAVDDPTTTSGSDSNNNKNIGTVFSGGGTQLPGSVADRIAAGASFVPPVDTTTPEGRGGDTNQDYKTLQQQQQEEPPRSVAAWQTATPPTTPAAGGMLPQPPPQQLDQQRQTYSSHEQSNPQFNQQQHLSQEQPPQQWGWQTSTTTPTGGLPQPPQQLERQQQEQMPRAYSSQEQMPPPPLSLGWQGTTTMTPVGGLSQPPQQWEQPQQQDAYSSQEQPPPLSLGWQGGTTTTAPGGLSQSPQQWEQPQQQDSYSSHEQPPPLSLGWQGGTTTASTTQSAGGLPQPPQQWEQQQQRQQEQQRAYSSQEQQPPWSPLSSGWQGTTSTTPTAAGGLPQPPKQWGKQEPQQPQQGVHLSQEQAPMSSGWQGTSSTTPTPGGLPQPPKQWEQQQQQEQPQQGVHFSQEQTRMSSGWQGTTSTTPTAGGLPQPPKQWEQQQQQGAFASPSPWQTAPSSDVYDDRAPVPTSRSSSFQQDQERQEEPPSPEHPPPQHDGPPSLLSMWQGQPPVFSKKFGAESDGNPPTVSSDSFVQEGEDDEQEQQKYQQKEHKQEHSLRPSTSPFQREQQEASQQQHSPYSYSKDAGDWDSAWNQDHHSGSAKDVVSARYFDDEGQQDRHPPRQLQQGRQEGEGGNSGGMSLPRPPQQEQQGRQDVERSGGMPSDIASFREQTKEVVPSESTTSPKTGYGSSAVSPQEWQEEEPQYPGIKNSPLAEPNAKGSLSTTVPTRQQRFFNATLALSVDADPEKLTGQDTRAITTAIRDTFDQGSADGNSDVPFRKVADVEYLGVLDVDGAGQKLGFWISWYAFEESKLDSFMERLNLKLAEANLKTIPKKDLRRRVGDPPSPVPSPPQQRPDSAPERSETEASIAAAVAAEEEARRVQEAAAFRRMQEEEEQALLLAEQARREALERKDIEEEGMGFKEVEEEEPRNVDPDEWRRSVDTRIAEDANRHKVPGKSYSQTSPKNYFNATLALAVETDPDLLTSADFNIIADAIRATLGQGAVDVADPPFRQVVEVAYVGVFDDVGDSPRLGYWISWKAFEKTSLDSFMERLNLELAKAPLSQPVTKGKGKKDNRKKVSSPSRRTEQQQPTPPPSYASSAFEDTASSLASKGFMGFAGYAGVGESLFAQVAEEAHRKLREGRSKRNRGGDGGGRNVALIVGKDTQREETRSDDPERASLPVGDERTAEDLSRLEGEETSRVEQEARFMAKAQRQFMEESQNRATREASLKMESERNAEDEEGSRRKVLGLSSNLHEDARTDRERIMGRSLNSGHDAQANDERRRIMGLPSNVNHDAQDREERRRIMGPSSNLDFEAEAKAERERIMGRPSSLDRTAETKDERRNTLGPVSGETADAEANDERRRIMGLAPNTDNRRKFTGLFSNTADDDEAREERRRIMGLPSNTADDAEAREERRRIMGLPSKTADDAEAREERRRIMGLPSNTADDAEAREERRRIMGLPSNTAEEATAKAETTPGTDDDDIHTAESRERAESILNAAAAKRAEEARTKAASDKRTEEERIAREEFMRQAAEARLEDLARSRARSQAQLNRLVQEKSSSNRNPLEDARLPVNYRHRVPEARMGPDRTKQNGDNRWFPSEEIVDPLLDSLPQESVQRKDGEQQVESLHQDIVRPMGIEGLGWENNDNDERIPDLTDAQPNSIEAPEVRDVEHEPNDASTATPVIGIDETFAPYTTEPPSLSKVEPMLSLGEETADSGNPLINTVADPEDARQAFLGPDLVRPPYATPFFGRKKVPKLLAATPMRLTDFNATLALSLDTFSGSVTPQDTDVIAEAIKAAFQQGSTNTDDQSVPQVSSVDNLGVVDMGGDVGQQVQYRISWSAFRETNLDGFMERLNSELTDVLDNRSPSTEEQYPPLTEDEEQSIESAEREDLGGKELPMEELTEARETEQSTVHKTEPEIPRNAVHSVDKERNERAQAFTEDEGEMSGDVRFVGEAMSQQGAIEGHHLGGQLKDRDQLAHGLIEDNSEVLREVTSRNEAVESQSEAQLNESDQSAQRLIEDNSEVLREVTSGNEAVESHPEAQLNESDQSAQRLIEDNSEVLREVTSGNEGVESQPEAQLNERDQSAQLLIEDNSEVLREVTSRNEAVESQSEAQLNESDQSGQGGIEDNSEVLREVTSRNEAVESHPEAQLNESDQSAQRLIEDNSEVLLNESQGLIEDNSEVARDIRFVEDVTSGPETTEGHGLGGQSKDRDQLVRELIEDNSEVLREVTSRNEAVESHPEGQLEESDQSVPTNRPETTECCPEGQSKDRDQSGEGLIADNAKVPEEVMSREESVESDFKHNAFEEEDAEVVPRAMEEVSHSVDEWRQDDSSPSGEIPSGSDTAPKKDAIQRPVKEQESKQEIASASDSLGLIEEETELGNHVLEQDSTPHGVFGSSTEIVDKKNASQKPAEEEEVGEEHDSNLSRSIAGEKHTSEESFEVASEETRLDAELAGKNELIQELVEEEEIEGGTSEVLGSLHEDKEIAENLSEQQSSTPLIDSTHMNDIEKDSSENQELSTDLLQAEEETDAEGDKLIDEESSMAVREKTVVQDNAHTVGPEENAADVDSAAHGEAVVPATESRLTEELGKKEEENRQRSLLCARLRGEAKVFVDKTENNGKEETAFWQRPIETDITEEEETVQKGRPETHHQKRHADLLENTEVLNEKDPTDLEEQPTHPAENDQTHTREHPKENEAVDSHDSISAFFDMFKRKKPNTPT